MNDQPPKDAFHAVSVLQGHPEGIPALGWILDYDETQSIVICETGGTAEERATEFLAAWRQKGGWKPGAGLIAGRAVAQDRRMGNAGAFVVSGMGNTKSKFEAIKSADVPATLCAAVPAAIGE